MWLSRARYIRLTERLTWAERRTDELQRLLDNRLVARLEADVEKLRGEVREAEGRVEKERAARDRISLAFADHMATRDRGHAISSRVKDLENPPAPPAEKKPVRISTAEDEATRAFYHKCARETGHSEDEAEGWFAAYLRGEEPMMTEGVQ